MAGPQDKLPGLEYLRDATTFQMEQVNEYDRAHLCKIFKIVSTNSVSYCCTVPNSNDLIIRDEKYGNNRFCINGTTSPLSTLYCSANQPFGWVRKSPDSILVTNDRPTNIWLWKLSIRQTRIHPDRKCVATIKDFSNGEMCGSITVETHRITWDMHASLSPALKASLLAQGICWAIGDPKFRMQANQLSPCGIDSVLWVDYTEQLAAEEEAVPVDALEIRGREFTIHPYFNGSDKESCQDSYSGFTLSDEGNNVLMMLKLTMHLQGNVKGTLTGFDLNHHVVFKGKGMHKGEIFLNITYGPLGKQVAVVRPPFGSDRNGLHLVNCLEEDGNPNKTLETNGKVADYTCRFTNLLGELVCTHRILNGCLKISLKQDLSTETILMLVSHAVKTACLWAKHHTLEQTPVVRDVYPLRHPMHLVRTRSGRKADFQSVFTLFRGIKSVFIRGAFRIADENAIFLHLIDPQSKEVIYTVRCEVGAVENYLLPFQAEIMDDEGNLVLFAHQPATVPTMMINQKEGNNIGVYEHGQCEGSGCKSVLQTDDGKHFGIVRRLAEPRLGIFVVNQQNKNIAGMYSPRLYVTELNIYQQLRCDEVMVIVAAAIRESFHMFRIQRDLPTFPTVSA